MFAVCLLAPAAQAATNITILASGTGNLDSLLSASNGTITTTNDPGDLSATLSKAALQGVGPGVPISIVADGAITFQDLGTLTLQTGPGNGVLFQANSGSISFVNALNTVATSGGNIFFFAGANLTVCSLNSMGGDVTLSAGGPGAGNLQFASILTNGSGNLTFSSTGTMTQSGTAPAVGLSIVATATGAISFNSLRGTNVTLTSSTASITAAGIYGIQASSQLTLNAATGILVSTSAAALQASNSVSGNVTVAQGGFTGTLTLAITGSGVSNSVSGGTINITNYDGSIAVDPGATVASNNGAITLAALDFQINGVVNSGTAATTLANSIDGTQIDLGTLTAGKLCLTQSELNQVTASALRIGSPTAGNMVVSAAITNPATWDTLTLINGGRIDNGAVGTLTLPNLRVSSTGPVSLFNANSVGTLASSTTYAISFLNGTHSLTIGTVDFVSGISAPMGSAGLEADNINIQQPISVSGGLGIVGLSPFTSTLPVVLGAASVPGVSFGITDAELGLVTAGVVGSLSGASITVNTVTRHPGFNTLFLNAPSPGGAIVQGTGSLSVANLHVEADAGIGSGGALQVIGPINVAFHNATSNAVSISSNGPMTIASVNLLNTSSNSAPAPGGTTTLTAAGPLTFNVATSSVGNLTATTTETGSETSTPLPPPDDNILINAFLSTSGVLTFNSGDAILFGFSGGVLGFGGVNYNYGVGDNDSDSISPPLFSEAFGAASIGLNGSTSLTLTVTNQNGGTVLTGVAFTDSLPAGLVVATPNNLTNTCAGGTATATAGSGTVSLTGGTVGSAGSNCTVSLNVTGTTIGPKNNVAGPVSSTNGGTGNTANASLLVTSGARGDFNADGKGDLLWHNAAGGNNSVWLMSGINVAGSGALPTVPDTNWQVAGVGDFNGDGDADVLWHNVSTGDNSIWFMSGANVAVTAAAPTVSNTAWTVAGIGDFQGDGKADILWHNTSTGDNSVWLMNGASPAVQAALPTISNTAWQVAAIGDFNGDGKSDILWHNTVTGDNSVWLMNGINVAVQAALPSVPNTAWQPVGTGDLNGDGFADVIWRNSSTGDNSVWFMNGINVVVTGALPSVADTNWRIARISDFQGDGKADLMWHNIATGNNSVWLMNGINIAVQNALPTISNTAWGVGGPP